MQCRSVLKVRFLQICFILLICSIDSINASKKVEFQSIYITGSRCNFSEKFIFKNYSCFAKSYSRSFSTLNVIVTAKMPLYNIFVSFQLFSLFKKLKIECVQAEIKVLFKYGLIYRDVIASPRFNFCEVTRQISGKQIRQTELFMHQPTSWQKVTHNWIMSAHIM